MPDPRLIAIGASAGGVEALVRVVAPLPGDFALPIFVVLHVPDHATSMLPVILSRAGALPAVHPNDGDPIQAGRIYVAPPDRHLVVERGRVRVVRGPRVNLHRPSVDVLLRSAARAYDGHCIGVVLTGARSDGTAGLAEIQRAGGVTIVQRPDDAAYEQMPRSAIEALTPDHVVDLAELPALLMRLASNARAASLDDEPRPVEPVRDPDPSDRAVGDGVDDEDLWAGIDSLEEAAALARRLRALAEERGRRGAADRFAMRGRAAEEQAAQLRDLVLRLPPALEDDEG